MLYPTGVDFSRSPLSDTRKLKYNIQEGMVYIEISTQINVNQCHRVIDFIVHDKHLQLCTYMLNKLLH